MESHFSDCGTIGSQQIWRNDLLRSLHVNGLTIQFALREYRIMIELIKANQVATHILIQTAYPHEDVATQEEPFSKILNRLRKKLRPSGLVIRLVSGYGYMLDSADEPPPRR